MRKERLERAHRLNAIELQERASGVMNRRLRNICAILIGACVCFTANAQAKFVSTRGEEFVTPDGKPLLLRGINLGNWLLPEGYMFKFKTANSPRLINAV